jgi:SAM-dependent methyltransferase
MTDSLTRFTGRAADYERYRQRYPAEPVLARVRSWCGLTPSWRIADVGAGTGMLTELFLANGNPVIAIEPNAEMRSACEHLRDRFPQLTLLDTTAEATSLPEASLEAVVAGRAFHWFDTDRALTEFRRILVPGGWVILVSIGRAKDATAQGEALERLLVDHSTDYTYIRGGYRVHDRLSELFPAELHHQELRSEEQLTWDDFHGQAMSLSVAPSRDDPRYPTFAQALRTHFCTYAHDGLLRMNTACWISAGRLDMV